MTRRLSLFLWVFSLLVGWQPSWAEQADTLTKAHAWTQRNRFPVRARSFFMATDNQPGLTDSYALAVGVGIGYTTPRLFGHLQLGGGAFFSANVLSSDLAARDPQTGQSNRYEVGLSDVQNPGSHALISRVEELYARYAFGKKSALILGRQLISSPFINPQDGRLAPTFAEGLTAEWLEWTNTKIQLTYLTRIATRSTVGWHGVGESIGLYPVGGDPTGKPSQYAGNTRSGNIIQFGITRKMGNVVVQLWNTRVQNVFNLTYARADLTLPSPTKRQWVAGLQLARQWTIGNGGNAEPAKAYMLPGTRSLVLSGRVGYQTPRWSTYLNATRITAEGRFLMPREWGRDPFYTFLARERNEGFGDLTAISANLFIMPNPRLKAEVSLGYYRLPDVKSAVLNKYGMPTYTQTNIGATYRFNGWLNGFDVQTLWIIKGSVGDTYNNARYVFNKVGMSQLNLIINYHLYNGTRILDLSGLVRRSRANLFESKIRTNLFNPPNPRSINL